MSEAMERDRRFRSAMQLLEPDVQNISAHNDMIIQMSIAISLRRIADVVAGDDRGLSFTDAIMAAIEQGIRSIPR